jgi:BESS motif/Alcohol dehydrogenase transcription factor Myb/SANT-like
LFSPLVQILKTKWNSLRDKFRVEYKKRPLNENGEGLVDPTVHQSNWCHYKDLLFLAQLLPHVNPVKKEWIDANYEEAENMDADDDDVNADEDIEIDLPAASETAILRLKPLSVLQPNASLSAVPMRLDLSAATARLPPLVPISSRADHSQQVEFDEDQHFLMSLRPYLARLDRVQKLKVRIEIEKLICNEILNESGKK